MIRQWHTPRRLRPGDTIAIAAPASTFQREDFETGVTALEAAGFRVRYRDDIFARQRYLAGSDARRRTELQQWLQDPKVQAVICVRGGYGTQRILPGLQLPATPKILVGYSDLTILHGWLQQQGWISFYGPTIGKHIGGRAPRENLDSLLHLLTTPTPPAPYPTAALRVIKPGVAQGPLFGGCLSMVVTSLGTPYQWPQQPGILFLEDHGEKIYQWDRMLTHLQQAGIFQLVQGVVFGAMVLAPGETAPAELDSMLREIFHDFAGPVIAGLPAGHCDPMLTLPLGCTAELCSDPPSLRILDAAVC